MRANIVSRGAWFYIEWIVNGAVVDHSGPFDDLDEAEDAASRGEYE